MEILGKLGQYIMNDQRNLVLILLGDLLDYNEFICHWGRGYYLSPNFLIKCILV